MIYNYVIGAKVNEVTDLLEDYPGLPLDFNTMYIGYATQADVAGLTEAEANDLYDYIVDAGYVIHVFDESPF